MKIQYKIIFCVLTGIPLMGMAQTQENGNVNEYVPGRDVAGYTATFGSPANGFSNRIGASLPTLIPDKTSFSLGAKTTNGSFMGRGLNGNPKPGSTMFDYRLNFKLAVPFANGRMVFYVDGNLQDRQDLAENSIGTDATGKILSAEDAAAITQKMQSYGFDIGSGNRVTLYNRNMNINTQLLYKLNEGERLSIKNVTSGSNTSNLTRDDQSFRFGNIAYTENKFANSFLFELQSDFGRIFHNSIQAGYLKRNTTRDPHTTPEMPQSQIEGRTPGTMIYLGSERNASVYDISEKGAILSENFTIRTGEHNIVIGSYDEFINVDYNYMNGFNGRVDYKAWTNGTASTGIDAFLANHLFFPYANADETVPFRVRGTFNFSGNDHEYLMKNPSAKFKMNNLSAYIQDEIIVNEHFRITPALRVDWTLLPELPQLSDKMATVITDNNHFGQYATYPYTPAANVLNKGMTMPDFSPRAGSVWKPALEHGTLTVTTTSGLYASPIPLGLLAGIYYNNGRTVGAYDESVTGTTFSGLNQLYHPGKDGIVNFARLNNQIVDNPLTGVTEVNMLDNKFKLPVNWNSELNVDYVSESKYKIGFNAGYGYLLHGLLVQSINSKDQVTYYRYDINSRVQPIYSGTKIDGRFTNIFLLTNRNKGYNYKLGLNLEKEYFKALTLKAAYVYALSRDLMSSAKSNFDGNYQYNPALVPNNPKLAYSDNNIRHTLKASMLYKFAWPSSKGETSVELTFNGMSGQPYTYGLTNSTIQNSGQYVNLLYIPSKGEAVNFFRDYSVSGTTVTAASQADAFNAMIDNESYLSKRRGKYTERNACRTPWNSSFDLKISQTFHMAQTQRLVVDLELFNVLAQAQYFVSSTFGSVINPGLNPVLDSQNKQVVQTAGSDGYGVPVYQFAGRVTPYSVNYLTSRFRPQLGLAYIF